jgi:hypothetical protein
MSHYTKNGGGEGSLGQVLARFTRCDLRSALCEPTFHPKTQESPFRALLFHFHSHLIRITDVSVRQQQVL